MIVWSFSALQRPLLCWRDLLSKDLKIFKNVSKIILNQNVRSQGYYKDRSTTSSSLANILWDPIAKTRSLQRLQRVTEILQDLWGSEWGSQNIRQEIMTIILMDLMIFIGDVPFLLSLLWQLEQMVWLFVFFWTALCFSSIAWF